MTTYLKNNNDHDRTVLWRQRKRCVSTLRFTIVLILGITTSISGQSIRCHQKYFILNPKAWYFPLCFRELDAHLSLRKYTTSLVHMPINTASRGLSVHLERPHRSGCVCFLLHMYLKQRWPIRNCSKDICRRRDKHQHTKYKCRSRKLCPALPCNVEQDEHRAYNWHDDHQVPSLRGTKEEIIRALSIKV